MSEEEMAAWVEAFRAEHGGAAPWQDENLLSQGLSPDEALEAHVRAKIWGEEWQRGNPGRRLTDDIRRHDQPRWTMYNDYGEPVITGGFGGWPPERREALLREGPTKFFGLGNAGGGSAYYGPAPSGGRAPFSLVPRQRRVPPPYDDGGGYY